MKKIYLLFLGVFMIFYVIAQDTAQYRKFTFDAGLGGAASSFQDLKYSQVHWRGFGITPVIELSWQKKDIFLTKLNNSIITNTNCFCCITSTLSICSTI